EAAEHDDRRPAVEAELGPLLAEQRAQLVAHDLHHLLRGGQAVQHLLAKRPLAHAVDERLDHPEVDIGFEQRHADLAERPVERLGSDLALALELAEDFTELVLQTVEHKEKTSLVAARGPSVGGARMVTRPPRGRFWAVGILRAMERRAKIMATLGPVSRDETVLRGLVRAGVDLFRLNLSHGTQEQHRETLRRVRKVAGEEGCHLPVVLDLMGPRYRLGTIPDEPHLLKP